MPSHPAEVDDRQPGGQRVRDRPGVGQVPAVLRAVEHRRQERHGRARGDVDLPEAGRAAARAARLPAQPVHRRLTVNPAPSWRRPIPVSEWHVIDLDGDPTPGDPGGTRELAGRVLAQAQLAERNTDRLASIAAGDGSLRMEGDYAPKFREELGELPGELAELARAYRGVGDALNGFAGSLEEAKTRSGRALRDGRDAYDRYQGALTELRALLPAGHEAVASSGLGLEGIGLQAAMIGLDEGTKAQVEI